MSNLVIPEGWSMDILENLSTLFVPMRDKPKQFDGTIPWVRIEDLDGKYIADSKSGKYVSQSTIDNMRLRVYPVGTVLCSCSATVGVCAITTNKLVTNQTFIGIHPNSKIYNEFLYYFMLSQKGRLIKIGTGTTIPYISRQKFEKFEVFFPTLKIQKKIVLKLDRIFEKLDEKKKLILELQKSKEKAIQMSEQRKFEKYFSDLKASILNYVFSGKLAK